MDLELKKYRARVFGDTYSIVSDEKESLILESVKIVDGIMREIAEASQVVDHKKIAVLAALKIAARSDYPFMAYYILNRLKVIKNI